MFTYAHAIRGDVMNFEFACQGLIQYEYILVIIQFDEVKYFLGSFQNFSIKFC